MANVEFYMHVMYKCAFYTKRDLCSNLSQMQWFFCESVCLFTFLSVELHIQVVHLCTSSQILLLCHLPSICLLVTLMWILFLHDHPNFIDLRYRTCSPVIRTWLWSLLVFCIHSIVVIVTSVVITEADLVPGMLYRGQDTDILMEDMLV